MITHLSNINVWVTDQDEALAYYTEKLGMELRSDVTVPEMGNFRWLTVGIPSQPELNFALMAIPGPPVFDDGTAAQISELAARGALGGYFVATEDCEATYQELKGRGVEFSMEPTRQPYGIDCAFRDPFGNNFRLVQEIPAVVS